RLVVLIYLAAFLFFFSSRRRHTRSKRDWSSDVCSSDLVRQMKPGSPLTLFVTMPDACRFLASASVIRQWRRHLAAKLCAPQRSCTAKPRRLHIMVWAYLRGWQIHSP